MAFYKPKHTISKLLDYICRRKSKELKIMKRSKDDKTLTRAEMEIMNIIWEHNEGDGMTTHEIIANYPDPKPAYSTIATFLKILSEKEFVGYRKAENGTKAFYYYALLSREDYTRKFMSEVKDSFFSGSLKSLISFFAKEENVSDDDLKTILSLISNK